jgi:hypothetical protein
MTAPTPLPAERSRPLAIDVLLREEQIALDFAAALAAGFLDERFFYWLPLSVTAWVDLTAATEYRNSMRAYEVLARSAPVLARLWPAADTLCGLGCGEGGKDRILLEAFAECSRRLLYVAADFSQALLERALEGTAPVAATSRGFKLDVRSDQQLRHVASTASGSGKGCIYAVLGNTLGAFGPAEFPARLRRLMRTQDRVIFDGEIFAGEETLAGYDNPENRRFAFAPLAGIGIREEDGDFRFELGEGTGGLHEVVKYFVPGRDLALNVGGHDVRLSAGNKLRMSSSIKYANEELLTDYVSRGGFRVEFSRASEDGRFVLVAGAPEA